jgi:hypothetical protein
MLVEDKHSSLFVRSISDEENKFYNISTRANDIKLFCSVIYECLQQARVIVILGRKRLPGKNTTAYYKIGKLRRKKVL